MFPIAASSALLGGIVTAVYLICLVLFLTFEVMDWRDRKSTFIRTVFEIITEDTRDTLKGFVFIIVVAPVAVVLLPPFLSWITHNATTINAISTSLAAIGTLVYVMLTFYLVRTTIRSYRSQTQPQIAVYLEASEQGGRKLDMVIHNQGYGPAYDVSFDVKTDYLVDDFGPSKFFLKDVSALQGLKYLAPHQQIRFYFGDLNMVQQANRVDPFTIGVEYYNGPKGATREQRIDAFPIDMWRFEAPLASPSTRQQIADSLDRIADGLDRVTTSVGIFGPRDGLKVVLHLDPNLQQEAQQDFGSSQADPTTAQAQQERAGTEQITGIAHTAHSLLRSWRSLLQHIVRRR